MKKVGWSMLHKVLPWAVLLAAYLFSVGTFALYGSHNLDADMSSEMVLADLLNEEGKLLTENWYYSSELRVVSPVPAYQLGLLLFDSWHQARTFGLALVLAGVIAAFLYMMGKAGYAVQTGAFAAAAFCLPFSKVHAFLFAHGAFYTVYFVVSCLVIGLVIDKSSRLEWLRAIALMLLGFISGMSGIRMPMQLGVPLILACAMILLGAAKTAKTYKELLCTREMRLFIRAAVMLAGMFGGYLLNAKVLIWKYSFASFSETKTVEMGIQRILSQIEDMFAYLGYMPEQYLLSGYGFVCVAAILITMLMIVSLVILLKDKEKNLTLEEKMIPLFAACAVIQGILVNAVTGSDINRVYSLSYFMTGFLLMMASMFILLEKMPCRLAGVRTAAMLGLMAVMMFQSVTFVRNHYRSSEADYEDFANWAVENGYTVGAATFWNANHIVEASDGNLDMYVFQNWVHDTLMPWLQKKDHLEILPEGKVIVFANHVEHTDAIPCADESRMVYEGAAGRGYHYDSMQEVMDVQREFRKNLLEQRSLGQ